MIAENRVLQMLAFFRALQDLDLVLSSPAMLLALAFSIWMFVDAVRREEWLWAILIFLFPPFTALFYFFLVYRASGPVGGATRGFELPGAYDRARIKELQEQIHHLDNAAHYYELGDIYFQQGKLLKAEECYHAAMERDPEDIDIRAHLGQCLLRLGKREEAKPLLEQVCEEKPDHDYGHTKMALAEALAALGDKEGAIRVWQQVMERHTYSRSRVQLAELWVEQGEKQRAKQLLQEVINDAVHLPAFRRKSEKVWVRRAKALSRSL